MSRAMAMRQTGHAATEFERSRLRWNDCSAPLRSWVGRHRGLAMLSSGLLAGILASRVSVTRLAANAGAAIRTTTRIARWLESRERKSGSKREQRRE